MLSSESIHLQVRNPNTCSTLQLAELKELMELYPYSSSLVTLYLKSLANDNDLRLSSQLEKFAYQIPNRALLFALLTQQNRLENVEMLVEERQEQVLEPIHEELVEVQEVKPFTVLTNEEVATESKTEIKASPEIDIDHTDTKLGDHSQLNLEDGEEVTSLNIPHKQPKLDALDEEVESAAISSSYLHMAYPETDEEMENQDLSRFSKEAISGLSFSTSPTRSPLLDSPKSFSDWLKMGEMLSASVEQVIELEKKPSFYHFEKPKKEFFSPLRKAKESVDEKKMPVSETLAKVFALQGNINKAIHVYEQLILIFPEKKSFFASQIRNLKRKLNS